MFDSDVKDIGYDVEKLVKRVNNLNINDDVYQVKDEIEQLEQMYNDLSNKMDDCDNDLKESSDSNTKPLINKRKVTKRHIIIKNNNIFNNIINDFNNRNNDLYLTERYQKTEIKNDFNTINNNTNNINFKKNY